MPYENMNDASKDTTYYSRYMLKKTLISSFPLIFKMVHSTSKGYTHLTLLSCSSILKIVLSDQGLWWQDSTLFADPRELHERIANDEYRTSIATLEHTYPSSYK